jgi:hypothetical protein
MKRISGGLGILLSFAVGAGISGGVLNYETKNSAPETQNVRTVSDTETPTATPTPTYDMTPPGVEPTSTPSQTVAEGDDGSLGGPVYNETHQAEPTYIINTPTAEPTSENASDDTAEPSAPATATATATPTPRETPPPAPTVTATPSADDHAPKESPSDTDTPTG